MKRFLQKILNPLLTKLASSASSPDRKLVFRSLSRLLRVLHRQVGKKQTSKRGLVIDCDPCDGKFIVFSDQHKGNKDHSDDFENNEPAYLAALAFYLEKGFTYINLGDSEELWKYSPQQVIPKNVPALKAEAKFQEVNRYVRTFGNHDLTWKNKLDVDIWFKKIFKLPLPVYEGVLLNVKVEDYPLSIFLTHGHQGDKMSDNNALSTWMVAHIWRPIQRYLQINVNTPAKDYKLRDRHNIMMHEWSAKHKNLLLITGHTHKPVFASGRYSDHKNNVINETLASEPIQLKPSYFNTGCCCYNNGDITGIEICDEKISLIKWSVVNEKAEKTVLEEIRLEELIKDLK